MRLLTVQNKIIALTIGIVLIFAPFLFYYFPNEQKELLTDEYYKEVSNIATTVALGVNIALEEQSFEGVETSMQHAKDDERLTFVALVQVDTVDDEQFLEKTEFSVYPEDYKFDVEEKSTDDVVVSRAPIDTEFLSGEVVVGFSTASINEAINEFMFNSFLGSLVVSLIAIFFGVILARSISRPINRLRNATIQVAEGDLSHSVIVKSKDEIGELSQSFNTMVEKLEVSESQLKLQKALVEERNQDITDSIFYAKKIQESILPPLNELAKRFNDSCVIYMPKDIVSGDFYWMRTIVQRTLISVADCTGHGVPGAFVSLVSSNALNSAVRENSLASPARILDTTNQLIREQFKSDSQGKEMRDGMDISLVSMVKDDPVIEFAGALNPLWIISNIAPVDNGFDLDPNMTIGEMNLYEVKGDKQPIGRHIEQRPFTNHEIELHPGDLIYMFSDGYADQFGGEKGKKFKAKALKELILNNCDAPLEDQADIYKRKIYDWMGDNEQLDDICVIGIKI